jgi:hypothetical protein
MRTLLIVVVGLSACAEVPMVEKSLTAATWKRSAECKSSAATVVAALDGVGYPELKSNPGLTARLRWAETDNAQAKEMGASQGAAKTRTERVALTPLPAFLVRIENQSNGELDFGKAEFTLEEKGGKTAKPYSHRGEIAARVQSLLIGQFPGMASNNALLEQVQTMVTQHNWLDSQVKVAAKTTFQGTLVFQLEPRDPGETDAYFKKSSGEWTVHIKNIRGPEGPVELTFPVERTSVPLKLSCPENKEPSFADCQYALPAE